MIAVEEQARKRLEQLSALHKVHPVDIAQLQDVGNNNCPPPPSEDHHRPKEEEVEEVTGDAEEVKEEERVYRADPSSMLSMETSVINGYSADLMMRDYSSQENMYEPVGGGGADPGPHREMAIDVPEGFHPVKKERPHYPSSHSQPGTPSRSKPTTDKPAQLTAQERQQYKERIKRYEEDLAKRREEEERLQREEEFLRTSLRGSKKLQALEEVRSARQQQQLREVDGFVNPNYDEEEEARMEAASKASTLQMKQRQQALDALGRKPLG